MISQEIGAIIKREMWSAFRETGYDLINEIKQTAIKNYMVKNTGKPQRLLSIRSGVLSNDLENSYIADKTSDSEITVNTIIANKLAAYHNIKGEHRFTPSKRQMVAIIAKINRLGYYDKNYKTNHPGEVVIPGREFIAPAIKDVVKEADNIFKNRFREHFTGRLFDGKAIVVQ